MTSIVDETKQECVMDEKKMVAFIRENDEDWEFEEDTSIRVYTYEEYVACWRSSWGGGKSCEEKDAYHDINGFAESGRGSTYILYKENGGLKLGDTSGSKAGRREFVERVRNSHDDVFVVMVGV
jgi:hypothetical protein